MVHCENGEQNLSLLRCFMQNSQFIQFISNESLLKVARHIKEKSYPTSRTIIKEGESLNFIICIKSGVIEVSGNANVDLSNSKPIEKAFLKRYDIIGESELFTDSVSQYRYTTVTSQPNATPTILLIPKEALRCILSEEMVKFLNSYYYFKLLSNQPKLEKLRLLAFMGQGAFGCASAVRCLESNNLYALKSVSKNSLRSRDYLYKYLIDEKLCTSKCSSPFIVSLCTTYQDSSFCYLLLDFINGVSLSKLESHSVLNGCGYDCLFYFFNLLLMLEYLKKHNIIHRDIKMSNLMINENGYLKLIDFGLAKLTKDYTYTSIGTPFFMAPEIILGNGYSFQCDYWSAGIVLYKLYFGYFPFGNDSLNCIDIYNSILYGSLNFPNVIQSNFHSKKKIEFERRVDPKVNDSISIYEIIKVIKGVLDKNPRRRYVRIKEFKCLLNDRGINLSEIQDLSCEVPYLPKISIDSAAFFCDYDNDFAGSFKKPSKSKRLSSVHTQEMTSQNSLQSNPWNKLKGIDFKSQTYHELISKKIKCIEKSEHSSAIEEEASLLRYF